MSVTIPWAKPFLSGREKEYVTAALDSTWISGGPFVDRFEQEFAKLHDVPEAITTSNGTTALMLTMLALNLQPGDEVIVPAFGFMAPANMVIMAGATPVFVEVLPDTWCISPSAVNQAITRRTRAVVAIHTYGNTCDLGALQLICGMHGVALIEDCAEAAFSVYRGRHVGTIGDFGCFSFHAAKTITTGEGGMVLALDEQTRHNMRLIRSQGMDACSPRYWHTVVGHNFRLTNMQAAIGCAQLERLDTVCSRRIMMGQLYAARLRDIDGVEMQTTTEGAALVPWAVAIRLTPSVFGSRDTAMRRLLDAGIETRPGFYVASSMPIYRRYATNLLPVSEGIAETVIVLPSYPELTVDEIDFVCGELKRLQRYRTK